MMMNTNSMGNTIDQQLCKRHLCRRYAANTPYKAQSIMIIVLLQRLALLVQRPILDAARKSAPRLKIRDDV